MVPFKKYLTKGLQSVLDKVPLVENKIRITTDTGRLFFDTDSERIEITDFVKGKTEEEILAILSPLPKIYLSSDTCKFFAYDETENIWVELSDNVDYAETAKCDINGNEITIYYAPVDSPEFTGNPTVPTPEKGDSSQSIANTNFVATAITDAITKYAESMVNFDTIIINPPDTLPETGVEATFYFVKAETSEGEEDTTDTEDLYDEYLWVNGRYEKIGSTRINLSAYASNVEISGNGNAITGVNLVDGVLNFEKGSSYLPINTSAYTGDLNELFDEGMYTCDWQCANIPETASDINWAIIVKNNMQLAFGYQQSDSELKLCIRYYLSTNEWSDWVKQNFSSTNTSYLPIDTSIYTGDINDLYGDNNNGIHYCSYNCTHGPSSGGINYYILVLGSVQIAFIDNPVHATHASIYTRSYNTDSTNNRNWTTWERMLNEAQIKDLTQNLDFGCLE